MLFHQSKFFVSCVDGRVGSYMLTSMLNSHSKMSCYGEIYNHLHPDLVANRKATQDFGFLNNHVYRNCSDGFKLIAYQWEKLDPKFRVELTSSSFVIFLTRDNLLDCYLSTQLAHTFGFQWREARPLIVDDKKMRKFFERRKRQEAKWIKHFQENAKQLLVVSYERLVFDRENMVRQICEFLMVPFEDLQPKTRKSRTKSKVEMILNYAELKNQFKDTIYSGFFDDQ